MYFGDRSRKEVLVAYGSASVRARQPAVELVNGNSGSIRWSSSPPPGHELAKSQGRRRADHPVTGLIDPPIEVRPVKGQVDDLLARSARGGRGERVLVTTLTKRMAED